jgi:hypothetical protein
VRQVALSWSGLAPGSGDALPTGELVATLGYSGGVVTPSGTYAAPPGNRAALYSTLADDGHTFAVMGSDDHDGVWEHTGVGWNPKGKGHGPRAAIYRGQTLHVVRKSAAGPYGYRQVRDDPALADVDALVTVHATPWSRGSYIDAARGLYEWHEWPDVQIGQGDDEADGGGAIVRFTDDGIRRRLAWYLPDGSLDGALRDHGRLHDIKVRRAGEDWAIVVVDYAGVTTFTWCTTAELRARTPLAIRIDLPAITRPLWCGFFMFSDGPAAPGNCTVAVRRVYGPQGRPFIVSDETISIASGDHLGHWVGVEHLPSAERTVENIEQFARVVHQAGRRPVAYWDGRTWPRKPELPVGSWVCVPAYRGVHESLAAYDRSLRAEVARIAAWGYDVVVIPQCYRSNTRNTADLFSLIPVCVQIAEDMRDIVALLPFHGSSGRVDGLVKYPEVEPVWARVAASLTTPALPIYPPPAPPPPVLPPARGVQGDLLMFAKFNDPSTRLLAVTAVKPVQGTKDLFTLVLAPFQFENETKTDHVFSCQGDGTPGWRKPGTEGGYEKCRVAGSIATFCPTGGAYFSWPFVEVGNL